MKRLTAIFILLFCFGLINLSYARRVREESRGFNYQTLLSAITKSEMVVPNDEAHPLNNIPSNFRGQYALYYLAQALEEAIAGGYIKWEGQLTSFETNRLNKLPVEYIKMLGAMKTVISYKTFFQWKQEIESDLDRYQGNEGQINFAFDYGIENVARLYDIFDSQYGWSKLHVRLSKISNAVDLFKMDPFVYRGENGQKELAKASHISHPGVLYYARDEFKGYSQDNFGWSKNVFTARELEKIKQETRSLSIESGVDVFDSAFMVHKELFNLVQQYGREEVVAFLENVGDLGMSFMAQDEENTVKLFQLARLDNWQDVVNNYMAVNEMIKECYKIYGTEARELSQSDKRTYQEVLENLDNAVGNILHQVNDLIITCALDKSHRALIVAARAQEDLKVLFNVISLYRTRKLQEEIYLNLSPSIHTFDTEEGNFSEIVLSLHEEENEASEASIRWNVKRTDSDGISLRLDKARGMHQVYLDIASPALGEMYQILGRKSGHHFKVNIPRLAEANMFKMLVRIFY